MQCLGLPGEDRQTDRGGDRDGEGEEVKMKDVSHSRDPGPAAHGFGILEELLVIPSNQL